MVKLVKSEDSGNIGVSLFDEPCNTVFSLLEFIII